MKDTSDFDVHASKSHAELLEEIGAAIAQGPEHRAYKNEVGSLGTRLTRSERLRAMASKWLTNNRDLMHRVICEDETIRKALSDNPGITIGVFKLLVDAFSAASIYVPVASLAVLVMQNGVESFCGSQDEK